MIVWTILVTLAIFIFSVAPVDTFITVAFTSTERSFGIIIPFTPADSQVLIIAPKLCGSSIWSKITIKDFSSWVNSSKEAYL